MPSFSSKPTESEVRFKLFFEFKSVKPLPSFNTSAPSRLILLARTLNKPSLPFTCNRALRSRLVSIRVKPLAWISLVCVVERLLKSPPIFKIIARSASNTPPMLSKLPATVAFNTPPANLPAFIKLSVLIWVNCLPAIVPWLLNSLPLTYTSSAEIKVPLPSTSPFFTTA